MRELNALIKKAEASKTTEDYSEKPPEERNVDKIFSLVKALSCDVNLRFHLLFTFLKLVFTLFSLLSPLNRCSIYCIGNSC